MGQPPLKCLKKACLLLAQVREIAMSLCLPAVMLSLVIYLAVLVHGKILTEMIEFKVLSPLNTNPLTYRGVLEQVSATIENTSFSTRASERIVMLNLSSTIYINVNMTINDGTPRPRHPRIKDPVP